MSTTYKLQGQTAADAAIATLTIKHNANGSITYAPATGEPVVITDPAALRVICLALNIKSGYPALFTRP